MDQGEDRMLAEELAALSATGAVGGRLVRAVAGLMRKNVHEIELSAPLPFEEAVRRVRRVVEGAGRPAGFTPAAPSGNDEEATFRAVVGGGAAGLNPVVVTARVVRADGVTARIRIRAAAKEGLIRQRAGERTAVGIAALLCEATGADGPHRRE
ncbi:hypothetical protein [Streptomyces sp. NPDC000983]|uniref:hypothetical protein n=1 Tax=Streptomyces sp. NPDC000983 TaxID=3154373 RepID=UPI0033178658